MNEDKTIYVRDNAPQSRAALIALIASHEEFAPHCKITDKGVEDGVVQVNDHTLSKPVRAGAILDLIKRLIASQNSGADTLALGPWTLDTISNMLSKDSDISIRLTDKERDILLALYNAENHHIDRDDLLRAVWGYVDGVETHTLETHIYRLRQKVEENPAEPSFLVTTDTGYQLI